jgi:hypothetical protein
VDQTRQIGAAVKANEQLPLEVRQMGADAEANSGVVLANLGEPEQKLPYTPANSEALRKKAVDEHAQPPAFIAWLAGVAKSLPYGEMIGGALLSIAALWQAAGKRKATQKLQAVYAGVEKVKEDIGQGVYKNAITDAMRTVAGLHGVYQDIKEDLKTMRST